MRVKQSRKGSADLKCPKAKHQRSITINTCLKKVAGGEEHVHAQMKDHMKANPIFYKELGEKQAMVLGVDDTAVALVAATAVGGLRRGDVTPPSRSWLQYSDTKGMS